MVPVGYKERRKARVDLPVVCFTMPGLLKFICEAFLSFLDTPLSSQTLPTTLRAYILFAPNNSVCDNMYSES